MISTFKFDHKLKHMYEGKRVINGCSRQKQNKKNIWYTMTIFIDFFTYITLVHTWHDL